MPAHPIKEQDILSGCLNAGQCAPTSIDVGLRREGSINSYYIVRQNPLAVVDIVPAFGIRVYAVEVYVDGTAVFGDQISVTAENLVTGVSSTLAETFAPAVPALNEIIRTESVDNYRDTLPWNGDFLRVDFSLWITVPATVRIYFEAI